MDFGEKKAVIVDKINDFIDKYKRLPLKKEYNERDDLPSQTTVLRYIGSKEHYKSHGIKIEKIVNKTYYCNNCKKILDKKGKFCDHSCSASFNNKTRILITNTDKKCKNCFNLLKNKGGKIFCDKTCNNEYNLLNLIDSWLIEDNSSATPVTLKRMITYLHGYACSNKTCKITEWDNKSIVLQLEHKNGNSSDNSVNNLCLLCPNCHSQTPTFAGRNRGNGRHYRRHRYKDGKSN